jgi:hypothetical protein
MSKTKRKLTADQIRERTRKPITREGKPLDAPPRKLSRAELAAAVENAPDETLLRLKGKIAG